jgi:hypothetical protein
MISGVVRFPAYSELWMVIRILKTAFLFSQVCVPRSCRAGC